MQVHLLSFTDEGATIFGIVLSYLLAASHCEALPKNNFHLAIVRYEPLKSVLKCAYFEFFIPASSSFPILMYYLIILSTLENIKRIKFTNLSFYYLLIK